MTLREQLLQRAAEIVEATLGGKKYQGKENPNNKKSKNLTIKNPIKKIKAIWRTNKAKNKGLTDITKGTKEQGGDSYEKTDHDSKRGNQRIRAAQRVTPK